MMLFGLRAGTSNGVREVLSKELILNPASYKRGSPRKLGGRASEAERTKLAKPLGHKNIFSLHYGDVSS